LITKRWQAWLLLMAAVGGAGAQDAPPEEEFLAFLGELDADADWQAFFDSVPDDPLPPAVAAGIEPIEDGDDGD
jgi:hypothetical protein